MSPKHEVGPCVSGVQDQSLKRRGRCLLPFTLIPSYLRQQEKGKTLALMPAFHCLQDPISGSRDPNTKREVFYTPHAIMGAPRLGVGAPQGVAGRQDRPLFILENLGSSGSNSAGRPPAGAAETPPALPVTVLWGVLGIVIAALLLLAYTAIAWMRFRGQRPAQMSAATTGQRRGADRRGKQKRRAATADHGDGAGGGRTLAEVADAAPQFPASGCPQPPQGPPSRRKKKPASVNPVNTWVAGWIYRSVHSEVSQGFMLNRPCIRTSHTFRLHLPDG